MSTKNDEEQEDFSDPRQLAEFIKELKRRCGWLMQKDLMEGLQINQNAARALEKGADEWAQHFQVFMKLWPIARAHGMIKGRGKASYNDALIEEVKSILEEAQKVLTESEYRRIEEEIARDTQGAARESSIALPVDCRPETPADRATRKNRQRTTAEDTAGTADKVGKASPMDIGAARKPRGKRGVRSPSLKKRES